MNASVLATCSTLPASVRTSSESVASASLEATWDTMPRSAMIALSSCSIAAGSWEPVEIRSIFWALW